MSAALATSGGHAQTTGGSPSAAGRSDLGAGQAEAGDKRGDIADQHNSSQAELESISNSIQLSKERQDALETEIAGIEKDRAALTDKLVTTAARIQTLEGELEDSEQRLQRLDRNAADIRKSLDARRGVLIDVLGALQRIGRRPPPAVVVRPEDALGAVRSAIAFGAVLPELRVEAEALASDLAALISVRNEVEAERKRLETDRVAMAEDRKRVQLLVEEKRKLSEKSEQNLAEERQRAEELSKRAKTLEDLIASLGKQLDAAKQRQQTGRTDTGMGRLRPAIAFGDAKGTLRIPVRGVEIEGYGADTGFGTLSSGVSIATRAGASVTSPCDAWIVYAGTFRSYGRLLILDAGDGYHIVIAGMESIDVQLGQFVLTGEPLGSMGETRLVSATAPDASSTQPVLYVEFRKDDTAIDPSPWWVASEDRKVRG
ncbi:murein hydrolase activator EnvC family protein [Hartmannibacter diazotrophicus]|uniref:murein hydrolase activator EnvC family protein n=1 Tax=Hartmannibacter diazotrophicus TaxID=1482074 RepID=UPI0012FE5036|nr:peptidoglycan DD-metalloendopeptidase family protein [Hartmannibacter diazotrophicus]